MVFTCHAGKLQWWKQTPAQPQLLDNIESAHVKGFFDRHSKDFAPEMIFEGKTRRRLPGQTQLTFVDAGLMPFVERESGAALSELV
ncbi:MAG: hypothetical protein A3G75_07610 [Verrucomicrobia bacterium RIFCSPLOWO2_12_FULL_64_8]|nr:MAG: hypothetical protein A3G75_07610 [Verrucomicrobia bacterium RIFCSPLOWO2_12_FULL_64_8]